MGKSKVSSVHKPKGNNAFTFCLSTHNALGFEEVKWIVSPTMLAMPLCSFIRFCIHDVMLFVKQIYCLSWLVCSFEVWTSRSNTSLNAMTFLLMAYENLGIVIFESLYKFGRINMQRISHG